MEDFDEMKDTSQETPRVEEVSEEPETTEEQIVDEKDLQIESLNASLVRLQADFANYKKRTDRERKQSIELANESLILKLLPVIDNLDRAFESLDTQTKFSEGIEMIKENFSEILKNEGLEEIPDKGMFDPNFHHAVMMEESENFQANEVMETFQRGYILNHKVIRPAMVKVSK